MINPTMIIVVLAIILAALSYVWQPLLGVAVILLGVLHFVPRQ
jgi:hypothetical protein